MSRWHLASCPSYPQKSYNVLRKELYNFFLIFCVKIRKFYSEEYNHESLESHDISFACRTYSHLVESMRLLLQRNKTNFASLGNVSLIIREKFSVCTIFCEQKKEFEFSFRHPRIFISPRINAIF